MSTKLVKCINLYGSEFKQELLTKAKDMMLSTAEVQKRQLQIQLKQTMQEHTALTKNIDTTINNITLADALTTETEIREQTPDIPGQEASQPIKQTFVPKSKKALAKNAIQKFQNFTQALHNAITKGKADLFLKAQASIKDNPHAVKFLQVLDEFNQEFTKELNGLFQSKLQRKNAEIAKRFLHEDYMQFLTDSKGNLLPNVAASISMGAHRWLTTQATQTIFNDTDAIAKILGFENSDSIAVPESVQNALADIGISQNAIINTLGTTIYQLLGITDTEESAVHDKEKLITSLGLMAVATLESQGILQSQKIFTGRRYHKRKNGKTILQPVGKKKLFGLEWAKQAVLGKTELVNRPIVADSVENLKLFDSTTGNLYETATFYKLTTKGKNADNEIVHIPIMQKLLQVQQGNAHTWSLLFKGEQDKTQPSFSKFTYSDDENSTRELGDTGERVSKQQEKNLRKYEGNEWKINNAIVGLLAAAPKAIRKRMLGMLNADEEHISDAKSVEGINLGLWTAWENLVHFLMDAQLQPDKHNSSFYLRSKFMAQGRAIMQGVINPQGHKIHRHSLILAKAQSIYKKVTMANVPNMFIASVGFTFGHEISGKNSVAKVVNDTIETLHNEKVNAAVDTLVDLINRMAKQKKKKTFTFVNHMQKMSLVDFTQTMQDVFQSEEEQTEAFTKIADALDEIGEGFPAFHGLVEYARYKATAEYNAEHNTKHQFTSNLMLEIDGMSNGVMIGLANFFYLKKSSKMSDAELANNKRNGLRRLSTILRNAGWLFKNPQKSVVEHLQDTRNHDIYQRTALTWARHLEVLKNKLARQGVESRTGKFPALLAQIAAMEQLLGDLASDSGEVTKAMRKLSKDPTMQISFGAGKRSINTTLVQEQLINNAIKKELKALAKLAQDKNNRQEIIARSKQLNKLIYIITGQQNFIPNNGARYTFKNFLHHQISEKLIYALYDSFNKGHGKALHSAIQEVYGPFIAARKALNDVIGFSTALHNQIRKRLIQRKIDEVGILTNKHLQDIDEYLANTLPVLVNPLNGKGENTVVPLTKPDYGKDYESQDDTQQVKQSYNLPAGKKSSQKLPQKKAKIGFKRGQKHPGMRAPILSIHMVDAIIANLLSGKVPILNVYDGFYGKATNIANIATQANKILYDQMHKIQLGNLLYDAGQNALSNSKQILANEFTAEERLQIFTDTLELLETKGQKTKGKNPHAIIAEMMAEAKKARDDSLYANNMFLGTDTDHAVIGVNHYNMENGEYLATSKSAKNSANQITEDMVDKYYWETHASETQILQHLRTETQKMVQAVREEFGSEQRGDLSSNPDAYNTAVTVNEATVLDHYDILRDQSNIKTSPEHDTHLRTILTEIVQKVMPAIELFMNTNADVEHSRGQFVYEETAGKTLNQIFMDVADNETRQGTVLINTVRMSANEIYSHELVHAVTHSALAMNTKTVRMVRQLYNLVKAQPDGYKMFLPEHIDVNDPANADMVQAAKERYDYIFTNPDIKVQTIVNPTTGRPQTLHAINDLAEFVAFGLTNEHFKNALEKITLAPKKQKIFSSATWKGIISTNLQTTLLNVFHLISDTISSKVGRNKNTRSAYQELFNLTKAMANIDQEQKTKLFALLRKEQILTRPLAQKTHTYLVKAFQSWPIAKTAHGLYWLVKAAYDHDSGIGNAVRKYSNKWFKMSYGFGHSIVSEVTGQKKMFNSVYDLLTVRNQIIDSARSSLVDSQAKALREFFKRELTSQEKTTIFKALVKTDLSVLHQHGMSMTDIADILNDPAKLETKIDELHQTLIDLVQDDSNKINFLKKASEVLGYHIVTGKGHKQFEVYNNAQHIVHTIDRNMPQLLVNAVDQLITLYALRHSAAQEKQNLAALINEDMEGVKYTLLSHSIIKEEAYQHLFGNSPLLFRKGYHKLITNPFHQIHVGTLADEERFTEMGFTRSAKPLPSENTGREPVYIYSGKNLGQGNDFTHGAFSMQSKESKGTNLLETYEGDFAGWVQTKNKISKTRKADMTSGRPLIFDPDSTTQLIASWNPDGSLKDYRYMMTHQNLENMLDAHTEYDNILAATRGDIITKLRTPEINSKLVRALYDIYTEEIKHNPYAFVKVGRDSTDPELVAMYNMLPDETRKEIKKVFGTDSMMIHKDILTTVMGQRNYNPVQLFDSAKEKNLAERIVLKAINISLRPFLGKKTAAVVNQRISNWKELTGLAKTNVIVRMATVTGGNYASNLAYLRSKGLSWDYILEHQEDAWKAGMEYQADHKKSQQLKLHIQVLRKDPNISPADITKLEKELAVIQDRMLKNPTREFIESGGLPTFVDDIDTTTTADNLYPGQIEQSLDKALDWIDEKSNTAGKAARKLFLTQDSKEYQMFNNMVKMTDFVARYILYKHYTEAVAEENRLSHQDAMRSVLEEFVNFDLPTHRMLQFANDMGFVWYSKYALRILPVIAKLVKNHPFDALYTYALSRMVGSPHIIGSIPGVTKGMFSMFGTPVTQFIQSVPEILPIELATSGAHKLL